ncbi:DNA repair protein RecN [bacterium]|nr:DNA repair protein RecN [bacterium]
MIKQLRLKNYILIDDITVDFDRGFNVITGETGSGKSILINAIDLAFSSRVFKEVIKTGCEKAVIELTISSDKHELKEIFEEFEIEYDGGEILLTKEISTSATRTRVNGTPVNSDFIKRLKDLFLDIHSQHQTYSFIQPKYHITLLDNYGKDVYGAELSEYKTLYSEYKNAQNELEKLQNTLNATDEQIEFLKFQINEIDSAEIKSADEDELLTKELNILQNAEKLKELTGQSYWSLNGDENSILDAVSSVKQNISKAFSMDESLASISENLENVFENLKEISSQLRDYSQNLENDTERLNTIQERLYLFDKLKHKYGNTLSDVINTKDKLTQELSLIENYENNCDELKDKVQKLYSLLESKASSISAMRKNYAEVLSNLVEEKLYNLELPKARFKIEITPKEISSDGADNVEFLISTNVSEDLKPLVKVASGGEISRIMLAIKVIFAQSDDIDTVIFDEIDTGISGRASQSVADEIKELAKFRQIILITHQAIIASKADRHFYINKRQTDDKTEVGVYVLDGEYKVKALAELAGGEINEQSVEFAKSLLKG